MELIPRKLALRALSDSLYGESTRLRAMAGGNQTLVRRGEDAARNASGKAQGRLAKADQCLDHSRALLRMSHDEELTKGPGLDAAVFGYLLAYLCGHSLAKAELRAECVEAYGHDPLGDSKDVMDMVIRVVQANK